MTNHRALQFLFCDWRPSLLFWDSPVRANFDSSAIHHPYERCAIFDFISESKHELRIPCHHIPLNSERETVQSLYRQSTQKVLNHAVKNWLEADRKAQREENQQ
jgi:hypothetical protein